MNFSFNQLSINIFKSLEKLGFTEPTEIQSKAIPILLEKETDLVGQAQTGTGKTGAFCLPLLEKLDFSKSGVQAVILSPTRELANQINQELIKFGTNTPIKTATVYGGVGYKEQINNIPNCENSITNNKNIKTLAEQIKSIDNLEIDSVGSNSQVIKDTGDAKDLDKKHNISQISGSHGIGHVRLATESIVDVTHSHPFWAYPFPDITVVHNGQLTNYRSLKRLYESKGHKFQTHNDSELIAVYLADKLTNHLSLEEALNQSLVDLDGSYTYLVSTKDGLGFAKEKWSFKPLVLMERKDIIALASEEIALRQVFPEEIDRLEPQENEVMTWKI